MIKKIIPLFVLLYIIVITAHSTPWEESVIEADDTIISRLTEIQDYKGTDKYVAKINEIKKFSQTLKKNPGNDVRINVMLISHLFRVGNIDSLKVLIEPSKKMCIEAHDENNFYYIWQSYCELLLMTGYEQNAMTESQSMLDHAELENSTIGQSSARNIIATIYMMRSDFKNAAVYYNRAVASYKKNNNMRLYYLTNINYISALIKIDSISQAKLLFKELDSICEFTLDNPKEKSIITSFGCALVLGQLAQIIAETDSDIEKSDLYIKKLYKLKKNHPEIESHLIYDAERINARIHKDYLKELAYTDSCEKSYKKINDLINLNLLYLDKSECLDNLGLYKESLNTYKQYIAAKDSFATNRLTDQLAHLTLHNDIVRIKIERQQEKIDEKQAKLSYSIYTILILAILLTIITIILMRLRRQNRKYNEQKMRYNSILNNLPASAYCKNLDGEFTFINKTMQELIGLDEKQLIGYKTSNKIHHIHNISSEQLEKFS